MHVMMHVFHHSLQDIIFMLAIPSQLSGKAYVARSLFINNIPPGSPRKNNLEISSLAIKVAKKYDMLFPQHSAHKTHVVTTYATQPHLFRPLQITHAQYWYEDAMLLIIQATMILVLHESSCIFIHNKHGRCSVICQPHRSLESNICILPVRLEKVILQVLMSLPQC